MKKILITTILTIALLTNSNKSFAWGSKGHALVAEVAFQYLDEATKKNVMDYLGGMSIEDAANWMDAMRSNKDYNYMKPYHYIDFEKGSKEVPTGENIITTLNTTLKDLDNMKSLSNDEIKKRLFYLFHLIGDLHQPLHIGYPSDKGGNSVQIYFLGRSSNLHSIWDTEIIENKGTKLADILALNKFTPTELDGIKKINVIDWAKGSRGYLKNVYSIHGDKIDELYVDANYPIIESQILKAGIRLAAVLEHYFKEAPYKS